MSEKEKAIQLRIEAKELLENPILRDAFKTMLDGNYKAWINTNAEDRETRDSCYFKQRAVLELQQTLINVAENGKILQEEKKQEVSNG